MKNKPKIGILGGMSPGASNYMYEMLIKQSVQNFGAKNNDDFPEIILHSIPVPDFISSKKDKDIALEMLKERVRDLNKLDISYLSIACNTAHLLLDDLQKVSVAPFVSIIDEVINKVSEEKVKTVGILGSTISIKSRLYQEKLEREGIKSIILSKKQCNDLDQIIRNVIKGSFGKKDYKILLKIADSLVGKGAEGIILGCTELPLVFPKKYKKVKIYRSVEILSLALLRKYYKSNTIQI